MKKDYVEPQPLNAGDNRLLLNGIPPLVDCRVISEDNYKYLIESHNELLEALEQCGECLELLAGKLQIQVESAPLKCDAEDFGTVNALSDARKAIKKATS